MRSCQSCRSGACPMALGRRQFLAGLAAGASALAAGTGLLDVASAVATEVPKPAGKPKVRAVFLYPREHKKYWMSWPGHTFDLVAAQKLYTKTLTDAACELGIQLDVRAEPVETMDEVNALLGQLKQSPPDGVIVTLMHMSWWGHVNHIVKNKGALPTVVLAPLGTAFTGHLQETRKAERTFVASTQDVAWLAQANAHVPRDVGDEERPALLSPRRPEPRRSVAAGRHHAAPPSPGAMGAGAREDRGQR